MFRDVTDKIYHWKNCENRKPLLITGVRQCGKTYTMQTFGEKNFEDVAYFDLERRKALRRIFTETSDVKNIIKKLGTNRGIPIKPGKTLLILDEIHACPQAIIALQDFSKEIPNLHVMAAGALVDVVIAQERISLSTNCITRIKMYPMSFSEFLRASDEPFYQLLQDFLQTDTPLSEQHTANLENLLKNYYLVGGLPDVVSSWINASDLQQVEKMQDIILKIHVADFYKYAPKNLHLKLPLILDSLPEQLTSTHHKFKYSAVKNGAKEKDFGAALNWLILTGLVHKLNLVKDVLPPLLDSVDKKHFKLYLCDVGLLRKISGLSSTSILNESKEYAAYQEAFVKNYMLNELLCQGYQPFFWRSKNTAEIDFLIEHHERTIPIEAKATISSKAKSYRNFCQMYYPQLGFRFSLQNAHTDQIETTTSYTIPLYLSWKLADYTTSKSCCPLHSQTTEMNSL